MTTAEHTADSLPDDLQPTYGAEEYQIPNNDKRKLAGYLYLLTGFISIILFQYFYTKMESAVDVISLFWFSIIYHNC